MVGRFHGTPYPRAERGLGTRRVHNCNPAGALKVAGLALDAPPGPSARRLDLARFRQRRRAYIEAVGAAPATTPMWNGRAAWLADAQVWALVDGDAVLRGRMRPQVFLNLCGAASRYADSATGRHMAATAATLARETGYSERTVSTWRALLAESGLGVLARQGSGGGGRPNRVPVWHLVSRAAVSEPRTCALPPLRSSRGSSHLQNISPSARARPKRSSKTSPPRRRRPPQRPPRPLALQRLAAALVDRSHGLSRGHIGAVCDALRSAGIDPDVVSAAQIRAALDADMHASGWRWPDHVERPGAFLAWRLKRISARLSELTTATVSRGCAAADGLDKKSAEVRARASNAAVRGAALSHIRDVLERRRHVAPTAPGVVPAVSPGGSAAAEDVEEDMGCAVCGSAPALRRPHLPPRRAHVCDACWAVAGAVQDATTTGGRCGGVPVIA